MAPVWERGVPFALYKYQQEKVAGEEKRVADLLVCSQRLVQMANECWSFDPVASAALESRADHWRSEAFKEKSRGTRGLASTILPSDALVLMARHYGMAYGLLTMSAVCGQWRGAIKQSWEQLWRHVAIIRFPRVEALAAVDRNAMSWRNVYECQLAEDHTNYRAPIDTRSFPAPNATEFVLSVKLELPWIDGDGWHCVKKLEETSRLPHPGPGSVLMSARLWESQSLWWNEWWNTQIQRLEPEGHSNDSRISVWISRGMKTSELLLSATMSDYDLGARAMFFERSFAGLGTGYYGSAGYGFATMELRNQQLCFYYSNLENRNFRVDNDSILCGFSRLLQFDPSPRDFDFDQGCRLTNSLGMDLE